MPTVWMRDDSLLRTRFHRDPDCRQLRKKPAHGPGNPIVPVPLEMALVRPCRTCYPDAPFVKIRKAYCSFCESKHACEHNGGVLILDRAGRDLWVWPDANLMRLWKQHVPA